MSIEEIEELTDLLFENGYDMLKTINESNKKVKSKDKEIERLNHEADTYMKIAVARKKRIDKAINYIENNNLYEEKILDYDIDDEPIYWDCDDKATNDLLSILKGSEEIWTKKH